MEFPQDDAIFEQNISQAVFLVGKRIVVKKGVVSDLIDHGGHC